jgi:hypothetical protein
LTVAVPATAKHINMENCTVCKRLRVVSGDIGDYKDLSHYHYRDGRLGPFTNIFALKSVLGKTIGVIVYAMPQLALELRNIAMNNMFTDFDRSTGLALVNKNIRCIARVIIEPRFRGLGLASRLVRETMPQMQMPIIEALAVMGLVNPFFEKAGMTAYTAKLPARCVRIVEALSLVGIERAELIDENRVHRKLQQLRWSKTDFIERQIQLFLQSYGRRRNMQPGLNRTRFILSKLTERPVYYIWFNQELNQFFNEKFNVNDQSN